MADAVVKITDEDIEKYKAAKKKAMTFWDKHKDKVYICTIAVLLVRTNKLTKEMVDCKTAHNNTIDAYNKNFEMIGGVLTAHKGRINEITEDVRLLKSIAIKDEK